SGSNDVETVTIGSGGSGNHMIFTGAGADTIAISEAATGTVYIYAGDGADTITAGGSTVYVEGGAGRDFIKVNGASTEVWGWGKAAGEAGLTGTNAAIDALAIRDDADMLIGGSGADKLYGQIGRDILEGRNGADTLSGGLDNDIIAGGVFSSRFKTGEAFDILAFDINAPLTKALIFGAQDLADGDDILDGGRGDDLLFGGGGSDNLSGQSGNDILIGDFGEVTISSTWIAERVLSTFFASANSGTDVLNGAEGNDILMAGSALPGESETLIDLLGDNIMIGDFADITGARVLEAATYVTSLASSAGGADAIQTGRGNDMILGGEGSDTIDSGRGGDIIIGDNGTIDIVNSTVTSAGSATDGNDTITIGNDPAGAGDPPSPMDLMDLVIGGLGNDTVTAINGGLNFIGDGGTLTLDPTALNALRTFRPAGASATQDQLDAQARTIQLVNFIARTVTSSANANDGSDSVTATGGQVSAILGGGDDTAVLADGFNYVIGDDGTITLAPSDDYTALEARLTTSASLASTTNDNLTTGASRDIIFGGEGGDTISSGAGDDLILGDSGEILFDDRDAEDVIVSLTSANQAVDGNDTITATDGRNRILAGGGDDTVTAGNGGNLILGDSGMIDDMVDQVHLVVSDPSLGGADTVTTGSGNDLVILGAGSDTANLGDGDNSVTGDNGEITFNATGTNTVHTGSDLSNGNDTITTGSGRDHIRAGLGDDSVNSGSGRDLIVGDMGNLITEAGLAGGRARYAETTQHGVGGSDTIATGAGEDVILAGAGADNVSAGTDSDVILGDDGNWTSSHIDGLGTVQSAILLTGDDDTIDAGDGDDIAIGSLGDDTIYAGNGDDEVLGDDGVITFRNDTEIETLVLTNLELGGDDMISAEGTSGDNVLVGQAGSDLIYGGNDDDRIFGDLETLIFDPVANRLPGQSDADRLLSAITIRPDLGADDVIYGGAGSDLIMAGFGDDEVFGGDGQDFLIGDAAILTRSWTVEGGLISETTTVDTNFAYLLGGYDELHGEGGADVMIGHLGPDLFFGNTKDDLIYSDGYAGTFGAQWGPEGYAGPTAFRYLLTSNFAGPDAIDVVSRAQQDDSIGNPLSISGQNAYLDLNPLDGTRAALSAGAGDLISRAMAMLESDSYIAAIAALIDSGTDRDLLEDALFRSLAEEIGSLVRIDGVSYELLLQRLVRLFLDRLAEVEGGDVNASLSGGAYRPAA
ncbi:MAG TPA: calcium-binding protein, partial [Paracoccaceae bacterium]|nr:calcium-binding protein [Paracoccaceae bacterium]